MRSTKSPKNLKARQESIFSTCSKKPKRLYLQKPIAMLKINIVLLFPFIHKIYQPLPFRKSLFCCFIETCYHLPGEHQQTTYNAIRKKRKRNTTKSKDLTNGKIAYGMDQKI
jgi:hypothetical protein